MTTTGKVFLVGAGPGDPELITVKAQQTLARADAVVYDRLVPLEWIVTLPARVRRYYVGKASQRPSRPQDEINALLADLALQGLTIVRLKGGDPFVFGRGGEEALYLKERGIPFEIIPGITAGIAAAAYAGIPVTHRHRAVFTVLLTAHEADDKDEMQVSYDWLGKARSGSLVGYMGVKQLPMVVEKLLDGGMKADIPAALIERGTTGSQKIVRGKLADLARLAEQARISPPALFIIGETVALADDLQWFGGGCLAGKRVLVTRPADQAKEMYRSLRSHGADVLPLPTIFTSLHTDGGGWRAFADINGNNGDNNWLVFTSENGVRYFIRQLLERGFDYRKLGGFHIAALGTGTERALKEHHLKADFLPSRFTSADLARELSAHLSGRCRRVVRVRGNFGDCRVEKSLEAAGCRVIPLQVYTTQTAVWDEGMRALLEEQSPDVITFTSGSTAAGFVEILGQEQAIELSKKAVTASIGPLTSRTIQEKGLEVDIEAEVHSVPGLVEAIVIYFQREKEENNSSV